MPVHMHRKVAIAFFSIALSSTFLFTDFGSGSGVKAQSNSITVQRDNTRFLKRQRLRNAVELNRLGFDRSGVLLKPGVFNRRLRFQNQRGFGRSGAFINQNGANFGNNFRDDGTFQLFERRRLNALRNIAIKEQRSGVSQRSVANDIILLDDGSTTTGLSGVAVTRGAPACPSNHNCGYRVYQDGSGPRIITPGSGGPADGLPAFDGVSGPLIITVE